MVSRRFILGGFFGSISVTATGLPALAADTVKITLWDKGEASMDATGAMVPMGMAMPEAMMEMATMGITADPAEFPAGEIAFSIVNDSQDYYHSVAIAPVLDPTKPLPYNSETMMVDEEAAGTIARSKELRPKSSGTLKVALAPGTYILFCNVSEHYAMGMWTLVTVRG